MKASSCCPAQLLVAHASPCDRPGAYPNFDEHFSDVSSTPRGLRYPGSLPDRNQMIMASCRWFRPGQGFFTPSMLAALGRHGYRLALGNIYPNDANGIKRLQSNSPGLNSLYLRLRAHAGGIIIVHDRSWTGAISATSSRARVDVTRPPCLVSMGPTHPRRSRVATTHSRVATARTHDR
jgi:hypothetical protein